MAVSGIGSGLQDTYRDRFQNTLTGDKDNEDGVGEAQGSSSGNVINAVFSDKKENGEVSVQDFLTLMVAQLRNQDFMNPVDDTQYVTQLAQFATMQQMQELAAYSKQNYAISLVGKEVTVAKFTVAGDVDRQTGPVEKISLVDDEYKVYVNGQAYGLEQIMQINNSGLSEDQSKKIDASKSYVTPETVTDTTATLSWPVPTDDSDVASKLKYTVYYSTNPDMDEIEDIKLHGFVFGDADRSNLTEETITGLTPNCTYYVNVIVKDSAGNEYAYRKSALATLGRGEGESGGEAE